jgi:integrase/recombinase XerC
MEDTGIVQEFLSYLKFERRFSEHTAKCYGADLVQFGEFLTGRSEDTSVTTEPISAAHGEGGFATAVATRTATKIDQLLLSVDANIIRAYLAFLNERQYSRATVARKLGTLRSFYKFLVRRNRLSSNPLTAIRTPKQEKKLPRFLEYEQVKTLLETPPVDTWLGARDRAILETLYSTGMRVSELVGLNMDDIDFLGEVVHIRGKGKKERIAPISSSALQVIQHYMEFRNKRAQSNPNFDSKVLFVNKHGRRLSTRSVRRKMDKYLKMAGLDPGVSPHTLRHSFATHMLNNGADLRSVQELLGELLGHQSLSTTQVYTHLTTGKLKEVYEKAHPREQHQQPEENNW